MKLARLSVILLMALALLGGRLAMAPAAAAESHPDDKCKEHCEGGGGGATVVITGGTVTSSTTLDISVDGGTGIADASGGTGNVAEANAGDDAEGDGGDIASAGNGGTATASANGGAVTVGDVNSGGNSGNSISVGNVGGDCHDCPKHEEPKKPVAPPKKPEMPKKPEAPKKVVVVPKGGKVKGLPATGVGAVQVAGSANGALLALSALGTLAAAGYALRRRFV